MAEITYPAVRSAQFTRFGRTWVVRVHASDVDRIVKAGGLTVTKSDGSKSRQEVIAVRELKSGATTWTHQGQEWAALDVQSCEEERAAHEAAKAARKAERDAARKDKATANSNAPATAPADPVTIAATLKELGFGAAEIAAALAGTAATTDEATTDEATAKAKPSTPRKPRTPRKSKATTGQEALADI